MFIPFLVPYITSFRTPKNRKWNMINVYHPSFDSNTFVWIIMSSLQTLLSSRKYFTNLLTWRLDKILMEIDLKNPVFFRKLNVWEFQKGLTLLPTTKIEGVRAFQTPAYIGRPGPLGSFQSSKFRSFLSFQKFCKFR